MDHFFSKTLFQSKAPFSHVVKSDGLAFISGIVGQDRLSGKIISESFDEQCRLAFENFIILLDESGLKKENILKFTIYMTSFEQFDTLNEIQREFFNSPFPSRSCLGVASLPAPGCFFQLDGVIKI